MGVAAFLAWRDIRDVKPKMIMTLVAAIMARSMQAASPDLDFPDSPRSLLHDLAPADLAPAATVRAV
jgi:hypothetical protein